MSIKEVYGLALLLVMVCVCGAADQQEKVDSDDGRLFLTSSGATQTITLGTLSDQNVSVGLDAAILLGLALAGLTAAVITLGILLGTEAEKDYASSGYTAPTSYISAPAYHEESSYAVHRSLEDASKTYGENH